MTKYLKLNKALDTHKKHVAAVVVINPANNTVLLGKRKSDGIWTSPAGHLQGEESPREGVIREAFEEANILLTPEQLMDLPSVPLKKDKMCHVFMAFFDPSTHEAKIHTANDPDDEVGEWKWFPLEGEPPKPMDENRLYSLNQARMRFLSLAKGIVDAPDALLIENTTEQVLVEQAISKNPLVNVLKNLLAAQDFGDIPLEYPLDDKILYLSKVDDGFYSGFIKMNAPESGNHGEVLMQLPKMTVEVIVQILVTKGYAFNGSNEVVPAEPEPAPQLAPFEGLAEALKGYKGQLHIHLAKSLIKHKI